jgi:hypothetical protein
VADDDNDGFQDVAILATTWEAEHPGRPALLHNGGNDNHWLTVRTVGTTSNRGGVGARVTVKAGGVSPVSEKERRSAVDQKSGWPMTRNSSTPSPRLRRPWWTFLSTWSTSPGPRATS